MRLLLLTSYCDPDSEGCSEHFPCNECRDMCNVIEITNLPKKFNNLGGFAYLREGGE
jgi:hypothetical protein